MFEGVRSRRLLLSLACSMLAVLIAAGAIPSVVLAAGGDAPPAADAPVPTEPSTPPKAPAQPPSAEAAAALEKFALIDDTRLVAADAETGDWISHGRTYAEQRYSPLDQINTDTVKDLKLTWSFFTGEKRGHEATPIAVDGVLIFTSSWSIVFAVDARTGAEIWRYDPKVPKDTAQKGCCDVVNRGVAAYKGRIYFGAFDGRLVALDAKTGNLVWETVTVDQSKPYTITGAPRIVQGKVIIGNGGAELGVRGYVSAYDAETGNMLWRTYTVPGNPADGFESPALEKAAQTWKGGNWWEIGGGGTVWDSMAYDPELDLLYVGTGNGSPWVRHIRSPGGGDNLYLSSILALRPDTGELVWHYQTTPGDNWDFTATQHIILADLTIDGQPRKVLMQAPKNGFFYVVDRTNGQLISAEKYVEVTWAERVDPATGRPVEAKGADFKDELAMLKPTPFGGHNWQPMSYSPKTGLVYLPAQEILGVYRIEKGFEYRPGRWNTGTDFNVYSMLTPELVSGHLLAWDPVKQKEAWRHPYAMPWNGGTLSTAGNLVFQGTADGRFIAFDATTGKELWEARTATGVGAGPITYEVDGKQYVTIVAGWGGAFGLAGGPAARQANNDPRGRVLTYSLATPELPPASAVAELLDKTDEFARGERIYHKWCAVCHGAAGITGNVGIPDLRHTKLPYPSFDAVVRQGLLAGAGMPDLGRWVSAEDTRLIKSYLEKRREQVGD
ncbi:MAG TPA: PQQ-dependent dehydrogenase, methanol/ethanol family [Candidatus Limnocylindrales bacterium]|nr:PQQ-dependent dehydrogenase, methanol/ethanol family [Candidatus Limnocylindrales bacterium]